MSARYRTAVDSMARAARQAEVAAALASHRQDQPRLSLWSSLRDQQHEFLRRTADALPPGERLWRLSVPATAAPLSLPGEMPLSTEPPTRPTGPRAPLRRCLRR